MAQDFRPAARIGVRELATLLGTWREDRPAAPSYVALADRVRSLVLDGRLPVHTLLPSERALAEAAGASRTTTTAAYRRLRDQGFADGRQGAGTWTTLPGGAEQAAPWPVSPTGDDVEAGDLSTAAPAAPPELYPAYSAALAELPRHLPHSGYHSGGLPELRARVAARYTARGLPTDPEEILVTAGAAQALRLVFEALLDRGDRVLVEHPTWPPGLDTLRELDARPVALPVEDGWADAAPRILREARPRAAYLMPDGQNPSGRMLLGPGRRGLATALADAHCTAVVDETLVELDLRAALGGGSAPAALPEPFGAHLRRGAVVHVGSASKTFWGGLRLGWVRADRALVRRLVVARTASDLGSPVLEQLTLARLLDQVDAVAGRRRTELADRCRHLQRLLAEHLPSWSAPDPQAGLVLWCGLDVPRSTALAQAARRWDVLVTPGPRFGVDGGYESRVRLSFGRAGSDLDWAVPRLASAWAEVLDAGREGHAIL